MRSDILSPGVVENTVLADAPGTGSDAAAAADDAVDVDDDAPADPEFG